MKHILKKSRGFTFTEIMIVVAIVAILTTIAYPSYTEYVQRGNRTEGQALLSDTAAAQERYYAQNYVYITNTADIGKLKTRNSSSTGKYILSLSSAANDGGYTITATPQFNDNSCGNLTLTATGVRGRSASGGKTVEDCWR